jgi:YVTN family beta-propeller protein
MLDARSGTVLRTIPVVTDPIALAVDERRQRVVVLSGNHVGAATLSLLDARSGGVLRTLAVGLVPTAVAVDARSGHALVLDVGEDSVHVLETATGRLLRTTLLGRGPVAVAVDGRTQRAFVSNNGDKSVSVLDTHSGTVLRTVATGHTPTALAVDAQAGRVVVLNSGDGTVSLLVAPAGTVQRSVAMDAVPLLDLVVDERRSRAFVLSASAGAGRDQHAQGRVSVLDTRRGVVLGHVAVGQAASTLALDATTQHLFVLNQHVADATPDLPGLGRLCAPETAAWAARWVPGWLPWLLPRCPAIPTRRGSVTVLDAARL